MQILTAPSPVHYRRTLEATPRRALRRFPAFVLTGPRQAGRTTLLRRVAGRGTRFLSRAPATLSA
ncbi:MAG: hypothetical protein HUU06_09750 [Planctomycetaceae bacterium]|nr:hypothetical protein [Planctomycetota bacterium]NUN53051.1 hypothetical protein [Planctomycetaceae bacterium]